MEYTGGIFWDVLLLSKYNDKWEDFYMSMIEVLPCSKCCNDSVNYMRENPLPNFSSNDEKNKWLWEVRLNRGGKWWRDKVEKNKWSLKTWEEYLNKPFTHRADKELIYREN